jgi:peptidoglycan/xylan/chitin deacetylase (PgdA/CDA1 family)
MRRDETGRFGRGGQVLRKIGNAVAAGSALLALAAQAGNCDKPVYLTFDTGHMEVAPLIAEVLQRQQVKVTFFIANEVTKSGGTSLDEQWAPWWKARAAEGHDFGSHTWQHDSWLADLPGGALRVRSGTGPAPKRVRELSPQAYCQELQHSAVRFREMTGQRMAPLFRAPGGRTSPALLAAAKACGFSHVPWTAAGFLGDELDSDKYPNALLLERALKQVRSGDILLAHLGIWSRKDAWAPAVLEPLIVGLKDKGLCFAPLREHPVYGPLIRQAAGS